MLIIDQWGKNGINYIMDEIKVKKKNDLYCVYVNDICVSKDKSEELMKNLQLKLYSFVDTHRRTTDTFDISVELDKLKDTNSI